MFFLSSGTLLSLRALNAAFICMVPLILVLSAVSATVWTFEVPRSTEAVRNSQSDVADDSENPLYEHGAGMRYT